MIGVSPYHIDTPRRIAAGEVTHGLTTRYLTSIVAHHTLSKIGWAKLRRRREESKK